MLVERIFYAGSNRLYLKTAPEVWKTAPVLNQNGPGAASRLLNFLRNISKTAPEAASRPRLKYRQNARFTSTSNGGGVRS